ncbi:uncharacterized protein LOC134268588 [Saccostrea cucullata]|uniref:uncharacterized protein LOC134268588 n=1 Tax=Saccostrea cuccullata TaxID=36930 RepID=UPI002ECFB704
MKAQRVKPCEICTQPLQYFCKLCKIGICAECVAEHLKQENLHCIVNFKQRRDENKKWINSCSNHEEIEGIFYCKTCRQYACEECGLNHHMHVIKTLPNYIKATINHLQKENEVLLKDIKPYYEDIVKQLRDELNTPKYSEVKRAILETAKKWHCVIIKLADKLLHQLQNVKDEQSLLLNKHIANFNGRMIQIDQIVLENSNILKDPFRLQDPRKISFASRKVETLRSVPKIGTIYQPAYCEENIDINMTISFGRIGLAPSKAFDDYNIKSCDYLNSPNSTCILRKVPSTTNGMAIVCLSPTRCVSVDRSGMLQEYDLSLNSFSHGKYLLHSPPKRFSISNTGDLFYIDWTSNKIFRCKGSQSVAFMTEKEEWRVEDLACVLSNEVITCSYCEKEKRGKIVKYDMQGMERMSTEFYDIDFRKIKLFHNPQQIVENRNKDICVIDHRQNACGKVVVTDSEGKFRFAYNGVGGHNIQSFLPTGIATDSRSNILISDSKNNTIHLLDSDGTFFRYLLTGDITLPAAISVDSEDKIWITEWKSGDLIIAAAHT